MDELFRITVQFLHVFSAILWIGGGLYTLFVQTPALLAAPPAARGPVLAQLAPRQIGYLLRVAEVTIATGVLNVFATGRARQFEDPFAQRWTIVLGVGILLALALYGLTRGRIVPSVTRLLVLGPKAAGGDAAAASEMTAIIARLRRIGYAQIALGVLIVLAMVTARLS